MIKLMKNGKSTPLVSFTVKQFGDDVLLTVVPQGKGVEEVEPDPKVEEPEQSEPEPPRDEEEQWESDKWEGKRFIVTGTLDWKKQPKTTFVRPKTATRFRTTKSRDYHGTITVVPTSVASRSTQTVWISETPGGRPIGKRYMFQGEELTPGLVSANEATIRWTQGLTLRKTVCELKPDTVYYLNYDNSEGLGAWRSMYKWGKA